MKGTISTEILKKRLSFANHAISSRSQLPILTNLLLELREGKLYISSTDLEIGIQTALPATITEEGSITVPARTFSELIQSLSDESITLSLTGSTLEVTSTKSKSIFQTISASEFPKLYEFKGTGVAQIQTKNLSQELGMLLFSASTETTRPALSGLLVKKEQDGFLLVATDGYRLSLKHYTEGITAEGNVGFATLIVPARVFKEVIAMREEADTIGMYLEKDANQVVFEAGETLLIGRLIEAEFPNFEKIIPTEHTSQTAFSREELQKAVKICSIFARDSANIIKFSLRSKSIIVSSQTPSLGENTVEVDATLTGEENEIAFNARYLLDVLANVSEEQLTFEMTGPLNPGVFHIKDDPSYLHLIMPIRIQQ